MKPSDPGKNSRKIKLETPKKIEKKRKKSSKIGAYTLLIFEPAVSLERGKESVDKFQENFHISMTKANI